MGPKAFSREKGISEGWFRPNTNGGKCYCGCGGIPSLASASSKSKGFVKGEQLRFIANHGLPGVYNPFYGRRGALATAWGKSGDKHPNWCGGVKNIRGYILIWLPQDHPYRSMASKGGYASEHRLMVAFSLGRCLSKEEVVHHKNNVRSDNRLENLELTTHKKNIFYRRERGRLAERVLKYLESRKIDPEVFLSGVTCGL